MIPSNFAVLATFWGVVFVFVTLPFILLPSIKSQLVGFFEPVVRSKIFGMMFFAAGVLHVMYISSWSNNWEILFSLMGYVLILKGLLLITITQIVNVAERIMISPFTNYFLFIMFLLGLYLMSSGYNLIIKT